MGLCKVRELGWPFGGNRLGSCKQVLAVLTAKQVTNMNPNSKPGWQDPRRDPCADPVRRLQTPDPCLSPITLRLIVSSRLNLHQAGWAFTTLPQAVYLAFGGPLHPILLVRILTSCLAMRASSKFSEHAPLSPRPSRLGAIAMSAVYILRQANKLPLGLI